jgi:lipid-A-disaccharide synthase
MSDRFHLLISAGEVSGDLQGSLLVQALYQEAAERHWDLKITALGGERMAAAGATLLANTTRIGAIGLFESLPYVRSTLAIQKRIRAFLKTAPPDLTVLIDYPGANIPLAGYLKRAYAGAPILYYIAPQEWVWAFGKGTTRQIVERTDRILAIFREEAEYYATHGAKATWVGHPFVDALASCPSRAQARQQLGIPPEQTAIALLPASRRQELRHILPILSAAAQQIQQQVPTAHFYIPVAHNGLRRSLQAMIEQCGLRATLTEVAQLTLAAVDLTIGKSGTVNLETALLGIPQIVVYCIHPVSGWLYRKLLGFKVPYISPVNLVAKRAIVPELLQEAATPDTISQLALELLQPSKLRSQMLEDYRLHLDLGERGVLKRAATLILDSLLS